MRELFDNRYIAVIEVKSTFGNDCDQALKNAASLHRAADYKYPPMAIVRGMSYWGGKLVFNGGKNQFLDFGIRHLEVPSYIFDALDDFLHTIYSTDPRLNIYLHKMKRKKRPIDESAIYDLITEEYNDDRYGNIRGGSVEYISRKVIEKNAFGHGTVFEVSLTPPAMTINRKNTHLMDAASRQIDIVLSCESKEAFADVVKKLNNDSSVELSINPESKLNELLKDSI